MIDKILCPTDFSVDSEHALRAAVRLAIAHDAQLVIAHVWHLSPLAFAGEQSLPSDVIPEMIRDSERGLDDAARQAMALGARRVSTKFLQGVPWAQIVETLEGDRAYDLVVMGRRGRRGLSRFLVGSVTEKVIRHAPCSVLAVAGTADVERATRVLCPVDLSESSHHAMLIAGALAAPHGEITLLHVVETETSLIGGPLGNGAVVDRHAIHLLEKSAAELRAKFGISVTTRIEIGHPAHHILRLLDDVAAFDLVVVASHGRTGIRRLLLGSVAEKVVRHAGCPVFVSRPRESHTSSSVNVPETARARPPSRDATLDELPHTD